MALHVLYQNVRGLRTKLSNFKINFLCGAFDLIMVTESWLNKDICDRELVDNNYNVFRRDRDLTNSSKKDGGGVLVIVRNELNASIVPDFNSEAEDIWIVIKVNKRRIYICCVYIAPGNDMAYLSFARKLESNRNKMGVQDLILICGDFNCPSVKWVNQSFSIVLNPTEVENKFASIVDTFNFLEFKQFNNILNKNNRILDLILCSKNRVNNISRCDTPLVNEDDHHPAVEFLFDVNNYEYLKDHPRYHFNFRMGNYDAINLELSRINWEVVLGGSDVDTSVHVLYDILDRLIVEYVPKTKINKKFPSFYSKETIKVINRKNKVHKKYKIYNDKYDYDRFKHFRTLSKKLISRDFYRYLDTVEQELSNNSKEFFKFISHKKRHSNLPSVMKYGDVEASSSQDISDLFADFFSSVFEPFSDSDGNLDVEGGVCTNNYLSSVSLSKANIEEALKSLNCSKGPGPDGIPPVFLNRCRESISLPLTLVFNNSLRSGVFPTRWKLSKTIPIHKGGQKDFVQNYRPITILSTIPKMFESLVYKFIAYHVKNLIIENQHGFIKGRSLETNLISFLDDLYEGIECRSQIDVVYTDFKKAFDKVNHSVLLRRLAEVGVCGSLFRWAKSYILKRSQFVCINGQKSRQFFSTSGVPQGSHLGPLFFIIYLNNMSSCFRYTQFLVYADDLKIFLRINSVEDCIRFQEDLDRLCEFCKKNFLFLNLDKCFKITFTRNRNIINFFYSIDQNQLQQVSSIRDLGVTLDSKLNFIEHIENIISSSNRMLGFVLRHGRSFRRNRSVLTLYHAFVVSKLNFASPIWNPHYKYYIKRLESVQHKFLKHLAFRNYFQIDNHDYAEAQQRFNLISLEDRRKLNDLCLLYKISNGVLSVPSLLQQVTFRVPEKKLRSKELFAIPFRRLNVTQNSPLCRFMSTFNSLSLDVDIFNISLVQLKNCLKNKFMMCTY